MTGAGGRAVDVTSVPAAGKVADGCACARDSRERGVPPVCRSRTEVPVGFTAVRFSNNTVSGADEHVGYIANLPPATNFAQFRPQVGSCEFARVDAIVVRACGLVSNERADVLPGFDNTDAEDDRLRSTTRALLEPLIDEARR